MRNLTKTLAVVSLLIPGSVYPLGIGEIKLHSALNQNLDAEISLILSPGEKVSDIKINLATPDKFDDAGVPWNYFLSNIRFEAIDTSKGFAKIKVTSKQALKEPFLNFLLEVTWPKGSLYREFTVLVDPPETYTQASIPVTTTYQNEAPQPLVRAKQQNTGRSSVQTKRTITGNEYGPTVKNDTLWKVAERVARDKNVSIEQMMIALYKENPQAFFKPNVNALLAGKTLKIPSTETILRVSRKNALDDFNSQTEAWRNGLTQPSSTIESASTEAEATGTENQLKLVAPAQDEINKNDVAAPVSNSNQAELKNSDTTTLKQQERTAATNEITQGDSNKPSSAADEELKIKIAALQQQMAAMQQLIASKDKQLEAFQKQTTDQIKPADQPSVSKSTPSEINAPKPAPVKPSPKIIAPKTVHPTVSIPQDEKSDSTYLYLIGLGGVIIISAVGLVWWRKRQSLDNLNLANIFTDKNESSAVDQGFKPSDLETHHRDTEFSDSGSIFDTDFSTTDFDVFDIDQGEIDPISEADVYLAYGRYQQAEDLIRHAINDQPERDDYKLKLLEIFYANANKQAFEQYAENLANSGKKDNINFWAKVTEMGSEICPDAELFSSEIQKTNLRKTSINNINSFDVSTIADSENLIDSMDFDLASFEELFHNEKGEKDSTEEDHLFDVVSLDKKNQKEPIVSDTLEPSNDEPLESSNNESIDFDFSAFSDSNEFEPINKENDIEFSSFEFTDSPSTQTEKQEDFSLESSENDSPDNDINAKNAIIETSTASNDYLDDDFDFNISGQDIKGQFGLSDLTEMDEMETKLDLAIAYIDMSDQESAKEIAMEVLKKGSPEQQMIAQALLDGLK